MKSLYQAIMLFVMMTVVCGIAYPLIIFALASGLFSDKANGSLVTKGGVIVGSELIAQQFGEAHYFWPRPSAGSFETLPSQASNLGPTSLALKRIIAHRRQVFSLAHQIAEELVPLDMITASASGLDPHISLASARIQTGRIARARNFSPAQIDQLKRVIEEPTLHMKLTEDNEKIINVLMLNIKLDTISHHDGQ